MHAGVGAVVVVQMATSAGFNAPAAESQFFGQRTPVGHHREDCDQRIEHRNPALQRRGSETAQRVEPLQLAGVAEHARIGAQAPAAHG